MNSTIVLVTAVWTGGGPDQVCKKALYLLNTCRKVCISGYSANRVIVGSGRCLDIRCILRDISRRALILYTSNITQRTLDRSVEVQVGEQLPVQV